MSLLGTKGPHKINNFILAAVIILFTAVISVLYSSGLFTTETFQENGDSYVNLRINGEGFTYSPNGGVSKGYTPYKIQDETTCIAEESGKFMFVNENGEKSALTLSGLLTDTSKSSSDGKYTLVLGEEGVLYNIKIWDGKPQTYVEIDTDIESASFTGRKNDIVYTKNDSSLYYFSGSYKNKEENAVKEFEVADGSMNVFYIRGEDKGKLIMFNVGKKTEIDDNVYDIKFSGGTLFYIKNFDKKDNAGELFYFNGKESVPANVRAEILLD